MRPLKSFPTTMKVVVVVLIVIGIALLFAQDQETLRVSSAFGAEDREFPTYTATLVGAELTSGNQYQVLTNGVRFLPAMLDAIRGAKRRISFETYIYGKGEVAGQFTTALADAAHRGIEVRLLVDAVGAKDMEAEHAARLREAGVRIGTFNPLRWYNIEEINYRTHRKILVVDGAVGFTGGAGVADHWQGNADSPDHWRDTHLRVTGPVVSHLEAAFYENWLETGHANAPALDLPPPAMEPLAGSLVVRSSPTGGSNAVKLLYLLSIAGARRSVDLQSPYVVLDESTRYVILEARRRGVRVRMLVEGQMTDALPVKYAGRAAYDELLSAGVRIAEYQPTMMHVKATVVDDVWSIVGSTNFDNRSFELNDEINVAIADRGIARRLLSDMDADWHQSREISLDAWRSRSINEKGRERLWSAFGELF